MNCKREYRDTNCEATPPLVPQLQLNLHHKSTDQGALADTTDTAGTVLSVRPGLTVPALKHMHIYGFVQLTIFSKIDGYQVFPHWTASVGASYAF
jgi:hypothetical protein